MNRALPLLLLAACAHARVQPAPPVKLWFGGDVELGSGSGALDPLRPLVTERGAGVVNLEGPVAEGGRIFNAPGALPQLRALGVRAVGIANNHALDVGPDGPSRTADAARATGLTPFGGPAGAAILVIGGKRIALTAHDLALGVPPHLADELAAARQQADVLIATFHVTGAATYLPRPELREAAEVALAAGAQVVVAHGTHALGPLERRGNALIAWGLGNVAFACDCTDARDAFLLALTLDGPHLEAEILPIDAGLRGQPARPASDPAGLFDLLEAVGTPALERHGPSARLP